MFTDTERQNHNKQRLQEAYKLISAGPPCVVPGARLLYSANTFRSGTQQLLFSSSNLPRGLPPQDLLYCFNTSHTIGRSKV